MNFFLQRTRALTPILLFTTASTGANKGQPFFLTCLLFAVLVFGGSKSRHTGGQEAVHADGERLESFLPFAQYTSASRACMKVYECLHTRPYGANMFTQMVECVDREPTFPCAGKGTVGGYRSESVKGKCHDSYS